jgi:hypothetical protein
VADNFKKVLAGLILDELTDEMKALCQAMVTIEGSKEKVQVDIR